MVKFFSYRDGHDLERMINKWIQENQSYKIISIQYQVHQEGMDEYHNALVHYSIGG